MSENDNNTLIVDKSGNIHVPSSLRKFNLDLSALEDDGIDVYFNNINNNVEKVKSISLCHSPLTPKSQISVLSFILLDRPFRYLADLDLSYMNIPDICLNYLCEYLSPFTGGYNISRLNVSRCNLGSHGTSKLLESLYANNTIQDILLTGNECEDICIPTLITMLTKYTNQIQTLALGGNNITSKGLQLLLPVLEVPNNTIHTLLLSNNTEIGDDIMEDLFVALNKGSNLTTLSLSNCGIYNCEWARYLPFMTKLESLDLSFNSIDDDEFNKLCKGLEKCYCLKRLDIGYNEFGTMKSTVIEGMLSNNKALIILSLCGNRCVDAVWTAIHRGLLCNHTLMYLDLSECNITIQNATEICRAFTKNEICSIYLSNNPLPEECIMNPRAYFASQKINTTSTSATVTTTSSTTDIKNETILPLNETADVLSISRSKVWCAERVKEISQSLHSLSILAERKPHIAALKKLEEEQFSFRAPPPPDSLAADFKQQSHKALTDTDTTPNISANLHNTNRTPVKVTNTSVASITDPELISQAQQYIPTEALRELVAASDIANTSETRHMHVAYGRAPLIIGSIELTSITTYAQARLLVYKLVEDYISTIASNADVHRDLLAKYSLLDAEGLTLSTEDFQLRRVWPEFCKQPDPVLIVRPGNWVKI